MFSFFNGIWPFFNPQFNPGGYKHYLWCMYTLPLVVSRANKKYQDLIYISCILAQVRNIVPMTDIDGRRLDKDFIEKP